LDQGDIQELVYEGRMTKTTSKERGKGPGKGKGRPPGKKDVPGKDGGSGSDSERLRQRILETEGRTLSDVEASGSGQQDGNTEDKDADDGDEIETEAARIKGGNKILSMSYSMTDDAEIIVQKRDVSRFLSFLICVTLKDYSYICHF